MARAGRGFAGGARLPRGLCACPAALRPAAGASTQPAGLYRPSPSAPAPRPLCSLAWQAVKQEVALLQASSDAAAMEEPPPPPPPPPVEVKSAVKEEEEARAAPPVAADAEAKHEAKQEGDPAAGGRVIPEVGRRWKGRGSCACCGWRRLPAWLPLHVCEQESRGQPRLASCLASNEDPTPLGPARCLPYSPTYGTMLLKRVF